MVEVAPCLLVLRLILLSQVARLLLLRRKQALWREGHRLLPRVGGLRLLRKVLLQRLKVRLLLLRRVEVLARVVLVNLLWLLGRECVRSRGHRVRLDRGLSPRKTRIFGFLKLKRLIFQLLTEALAQTDLDNFGLLGLRNWRGLDNRDALLDLFLDGALQCEELMSGCLLELLHAESLPCWGCRFADGLRQRNTNWAVLRHRDRLRLIRIGLLIGLVFLLYNLLLLWLLHLWEGRLWDRRLLLRRLLLLRLLLFLGVSCVLLLLPAGGVHLRRTGGGAFDRVRIPADGSNVVVQLFFDVVQFLLGFPVPTSLRLLSIGEGWLAGSGVVALLRFALG